MACNYAHKYTVKNVAKEVDCVMWIHTDVMSGTRSSLYGADGRQRVQ